MVPVRVATVFPQKYPANSPKVQVVKTCIMLLIKTYVTINIYEIQTCIMPLYKTYVTINIYEIQTCIMLLIKTYVTINIYEIQIQYKDCCVYFVHYSHKKAGYYYIRRGVRCPHIRRW